jgi:cytochrome c biogenesis protein
MEFTEMTTIARQQARIHASMPAIAHAVWRFLASMRLALFLIVALAIVVFAGTLIDQAPLPVVSDPVAYARWLDDADGKYGQWTGALDRLQLFNIFHSTYFRGLLGLLAVNILVCTMSRWRGIWNTVFHTRARTTESFLAHAHYSARMQTALPAAEAAERLRKSLARSRYRVTVEAEPGSVAVFGDKNRLSRFGTFFTHLSLILILLGAMAGGIWGFDNPRFSVAEGSTRDLGLGTGLAVRLNEFADEYHADGTPADYRAEVTLLDSGEPVKTGVIRVNAPMRYNGIAFHQSFFGQAAVMTVRDASGTILFSDAVPLSGESGQAQRPAGSFSIPGEGITVNVAGPSLAGPDPLVSPGEVRVDVFHGGVRAVSPRNLTVGTPSDIAGLTFTFEREARFVGLNVVKDPGMNIIWVACAFMVAGLVMLFYLPRRRIWALCVERPGGSVDVLIGMPAQRDAPLEQEFDRLQAKLADTLDARTAHPETTGAHHG